MVQWFTLRWKYHKIASYYTSGKLLDIGGGRGEFADFIAKKGWDVVFLDATILAENPRLSPYLIGMKSSISKVLGLACSNINVKSTTTDGLGFIGAEEGIASMAICTLGRSS